MLRRVSKILFLETDFGIGKEAEMRLLTFAFLAIVLAVTAQLGLYKLLYAPLEAMHGFGTALFFLAPAIVTVALAYAMRIPNRGFVVFLTILSPFVSWILGFLVVVYVFHELALF